MTARKRKPEHKDRRPAPTRREAPRFITSPGIPAGAMMRFDDDEEPITNTDPNFARDEEE